MRERIIGLVGEEAGRQVAMGTFHSLCARVLRRDGRSIGIDARFTVYDTDDQTSLMKQVLRELDLAASGETRPAVMLGQVSRWKNDLVEPAEATETARTYHEQLAARAYAAYQVRLRKAGGLDFDDLLNEAVRLFEQAPDVLATLPGQVALPPCRRVPGHEPRSIPLGAPARRAPPQPGRRRRRRPEHLQLAWGGPAQHPRLRARLPQGDRGQAGAELPLDAAHPRRRARGRLAQRGPQGQEALDPERPGRAHRALRGRSRGRGGGVDRPPDRRPRPGQGRRRLDPRSAGGRGRRPPLPTEGHRGHVPHECAVASDRGSVPPLRPPLPARRRHALLPAPRGQGRAGLSADAAQRPRRGRPSSASSTCPPAASATRRWSTCERWRRPTTATSGRPSC